MTLPTLYDCAADNRDTQVILKIFGIVQEVQQVRKDSVFFHSVVLGPETHEMHDIQIDT